MNLVKKISIVLYAFLVLGFILYVADYRAGSLALFLLVPLLAILLNVIFIAKLKRYENYGSNNLLQFSSLFLSSLSCLLLFIYFILDLLNWKGIPEFMFTVLLPCLISNGLVILADLVISYRKNKKIHGLQFYVLALPIILLIGNTKMKSFQDAPSAGVLKASLYQDHSLALMKKNIDLNNELHSVVKTTVPNSNLVLDPLRKEREELILEMENLKAYLTTASKKESGDASSGKETEFIRTEMIGNNDQKGRGYHLKLKMDRYLSHLKKNGLHSESPSSSHEHLIYKNHSKENLASFEERFFNDVNVEEASILLTSFEEEVLSLEREFLNQYLLNHSLSNPR